MILFEETRPATHHDVHWLRQNLGRRLEDSCLRAIDPRLGLKSLPAQLIESVLAAVGDISSFIVQHTAPKPTYLSVEVQIVGQRLRIEFRMDGGGFKDTGQALETAGRGLQSAGPYRRFSEGLEDVEYYPGAPNLLIGWRRLRNGQRHVLIVAKDAEERASLRSMLRQNYETSSASSAVEAQAILESKNIDAIVASYNDGRQGGPFKAQFDESPIPVILLAWANEFEEFRRQPFYIDQCLQKPVSTFALITAIETAISSYTRRLIHIANYFGSSAGVLLAGDLPSEFPGLKLEVLSGTASYGGGDFALALEGQGYTRLILADIMGHGLKAKAGAIALSSIIRTLHRQAGVPVAALLQSASQVVANEPAFAGIISTLIAVDIGTDGLIEVASAGHPPAAIVSPEKTFVLPVTGPIPGLLPNPVYQTVTHRLSPGEKIAIVTDGIDSQSSATGEFPIRLLRQLAKNHDLPVKLLKAEMEKWLTRRLGPAPKDDWTLLIAEYSGAPGQPARKRRAAKEEREAPAFAE